MKSVIITGASSGIGLETAKKFLEEGWFVVGTSPTGIIDLKKIHSVRLDYFDQQSIKAAVEALQNFNMTFDVLINNAAINIDHETDKVMIDTLRKTIEVNLFGTVDITEQLIPSMHNNGHILNISSFNASLSEFAEWNLLIPSYRISKASLNMYTKVLAKRLKGSIRVSALDPGWVKTPMGGPEATRLPEEVASEIFDLSVNPKETGEFWFKGEKRKW